MLDSEGKIMDFPTEFHAIGFLKSHGVDDPKDELIDIVYEEEERPTDKVSTDGNLFS